MKRSPLLRFSTRRTPFGRVVSTWKSVWSPMTASTFWTLSARSTTGPVGSVSVPAVAPRWPIATIDVHLRRLERRRLGVHRGGGVADVERVERAWEDERRRVLVREADQPDLDAVEARTSSTATTPSASCPAASTTLADTYGNCASGISVFRRYAWPLSKLWFPSPSAVEAHQVHELDRRRVAEEGRDRRSRADRVSGGDGDRAARRSPTG